MEPDFNLTPMEIIFLIVAVLVTIPLVIFVRYVLKELKKENDEGRGPGQDDSRPGAS